MTDDKYTAVDFPREHPRQEVADHEILMAFNGDPDAALFLEWWYEKGAAAFGAWLEKQKGKR